MTNPTLERAARAVQDATSGELTEGQNLRIARAVLMAVLDDADAAGETEYRFIRAILAEGE